jgi:PBSX family phage terminase large subunit
MSVSKKDAIRQLWKIGNLDYKRRSNQILMRDHIQNASKKIVPILASRRNGKSFEILLQAIELCNSKKYAIVKYICPRLKMVKTIVNFNMRIILEDCPDEMRPEWKENDKIWLFPNGSEIQFAGTDNGSHESLRGGSADLCIVDEAGFCDHLEYVIKSILRPTILTTGGKIIMISTPSKSSDHEFIQVYVLPEKLNKTLLILKVHDNPSLSEEEIESLKEDYPTGDQDPHYRREYLCEIIRDKDAVVIPEFTPEKENEIVKEWKRPPFYDSYTSGDVGFRDLTVYLFAYWDFKQAKLIIEDELTTNGPEMTTEFLAEKIREKELEHFHTVNAEGEKEPKHIFMRVMDNNLVMMNDLNRIHNLNFIGSQKDNKEAQINAVRMMINNNQIIIHPRCKHLIYHLKGASWKQGSSVNRIFAHLSDTQDHSVRGGHADALDALIYLVRNLVTMKNPYPSNYDLPSGDDTFFGYHQEKKMAQENDQLKQMVRMIMNLKDKD